VPDYPELDILQYTIRLITPNKLGIDKKKNFHFILYFHPLLILLNFISKLWFTLT
jgi:hypothetical protein